MRLSNIYDLKIKLSRLISNLIKVAHVFTLFIASAQPQMIYQDPRAPLNQRVGSLLHELSLEEKISLLGHESPAISRLGIPAYNWWNEALHGVARAGEATVFPQAIGLAATFNDSLVEEVAKTISTEARAKYNLASASGNRSQYLGLSFWSPNINLFRDPRWGRGQETYGEDPFLTASMGMAFVRGMQGNDHQYLKTAAGAKHFAVHSGPEAERHGFNAVVDEKDLRETYLYAFNKLVGSEVETVMCAYNRINGEPCCTGQGLLRNILRNEWHFSGQVVTDCGALNDIMDRTTHKPSPEELAASAIKAGINLECGSILQNDLKMAVEHKLVSVTEIDSALAPTLRTRFKLGLFDPPEIQPYHLFGADSIHNPFHIELSRRVARESIVLLKNNGILPLQKNKYGSIMVVGSNASSLDALVGNYHGFNGDMISFAEGITKAAGPAIAVQYDQGYDNRDTVHFGGIWAASMSDLTIAVIGLTPVLEGEEGDAFLSPSGGDKTMNLPEAQIIYLKKLKKATRKPLILVISRGSCFDLSPIESLADAILLTWYPGEQGGQALADILFGRNSPSGHLPISFYRSLDQLPDYKQYAMKGRTYRYFSGTVQYPFGFGLTYTRFNYSWSQFPKEVYSGRDTMLISVNIQNAGNYDAMDLVQAYIQYPPEPDMPLRELKAYRKIWIQSGSSARAALYISLSDLKKWDSIRHEWKIYSGEYHLIIGEHANDHSLEVAFTLK